MDFTGAKRSSSFSIVLIEKTLFHGSVQGHLLRTSNLIVLSYDWFGFRLLKQNQLWSSRRSNRICGFLLESRFLLSGKLSKGRVETVEIGFLRGSAGKNIFQLPDHRLKTHSKFRVG